MHVTISVLLVGILVRDSVGIRCRECYSLFLEGDEIPTNEEGIVSCEDANYKNASQELIAEKYSRTCSATEKADDVTGCYGMTIEGMKIGPLSGSMMRFGCSSSKAFGIEINSCDDVTKQIPELKDADFGVACLCNGADFCNHESFGFDLVSADKLSEFYKH